MYEDIFLKKCEKHKIPDFVSRAVICEDIHKPCKCIVTYKKLSVKC